MEILTVEEIPRPAVARGPKTVYRPKVKPGESATLTPLGKSILHGTAARCGVSRNDVFEHLLRLYGGRLRAEEFEPIDDAA